MFYMFNTSLQQFYSCYYNLVNPDELSISQMTMDLLLFMPRLLPDLTVYE